MNKTLNKIINAAKNFSLPRFKPFTSAIVTVGGSGTRMQTKGEGGKTKQFLDILGIPVVARTLIEFQNSPYIDEIIIVSKQDELDYYTELIDKYGLSKVNRIVKGGKTRQESVLNGFKVISEKAKYVAIHDGVRCLITGENIRNVVKTAYAFGAAAAATKIYDTLKMTDSSMTVTETPDREKAWAAQTPQVFSSDLYRACAFSAEKEGLSVTDDCMLAENYGFKIKLVDCGRHNLKITTPDDLVIAEAILLSRQGNGGKYMKIGHGYDVHRLVKGRKFIMGGVEIPHETGLYGHSDADVLLHAIMDAVLGALGLGDIGLHFPDKDEKYKGISSVLLAKETAKLLEQNNFKISNIDATVILQEPKLRPYIDDMRKNVADIYSVDISQVNIKATTEEGLGFTGNKEGVSAHAVCIIEK